MDSAGTTVEVWRKEEGFLEEAVRGVPGIVWVDALVGVEPAAGAFAVAVGCPPTLNVDVEAVAWWGPSRNMTAAAPIPPSCPEPSVNL